MGIERAYSAFVSAAVCSCMYLLHTLWVGYTVLVLGTQYWVHSTQYTAH